MTVQNLATVFGPNILWPKVEDPVAMMEGQCSCCVYSTSFRCHGYCIFVTRQTKARGSTLPEGLKSMTEKSFVFSGTVLVRQLMAVLIGRHDALFPQGEDSPTSLELVNNNNIDLQRRQSGTAATVIAVATQNAENNNTQVARQCVWETADSPHPQNADKSGSPRPASPRTSAFAGRFDLSRSPPLTLKKNPAFSKGSGIVTNGSFSSSPSSDPGQEKNTTLTGGGSLPLRRSGVFKASGTKMGTSGAMSGGSTGASGPTAARTGLSGIDHTGSANSRNGLWISNGCVTLRENNKTRDGVHGDQISNQNRLSTYDNVQLNHQNLLQQSHMGHTCLNSSSEDKQSVDSATWSTSSCEISLPDNSTSCRSSTTTCPEKDFYGGHYDLDGPGQDNELFQPGGSREAERGNSNGEGSGAFSSSRGTNSSDNSSSSDAAFAVGNAAGSLSAHSALHSLVASLKQEMHKQKGEYETRIKRYRNFLTLAQDL